MEHLLSCLLMNSPGLTDIVFESLSGASLTLIAAHCGATLRSIKAETTCRCSEEVARMCEVSPNLVHLGLDLLVDCDEVVLAAVCHCPLIEAVPTHDITDVALDALSGIHTLKELKISSHSDLCSSGAIQRVLRANPDIVDIAVDIGSCIDDSFVSLIGASFAHLKSLCLGGCGDPFAALSGPALRDLFRSCPLLERLSIRQSEYVISKASLRALFQSCPHLSDLSLELAEPPESTDDDEAILDPRFAPPPLTDLYISGGGSVATRLLGDLFSRGTSIRVLGLHDCMQVVDDTIISLAPACPLLEDLDISQDESGFVSKAALRVLFQSCRHLADMSLCFEDVSPAEADDGDDLDVSCPSLIWLVVTGDGLADDTLRAIFTHCTGLQHVQLHECHMITDKAVTALAHSCHKLVELGVYDCKMLTIAAPLEVASCCPALVDLSLYDMPLGDDALIRLSRCPNLVSLVISLFNTDPSKCQITKTGVLAVVNKCKKLELFAIQGFSEKISRMLERLDDAKRARRL